MFNVSFDRGLVRRVEGAPVPVPSEFPGWVIFVHNVITSAGLILDDRFQATEMTTGSALPGLYPSPELAAEKAIECLRMNGPQKAEEAIVDAVARLLRAGIRFPVNDCDDIHVRGVLGV